MNQPAFPWVEPATTYKTTLVNHGMTLRDYFAAKAMQAIIMSIDDKDDMSAPVAESSYKWADAMMKAREA
jgi:hypothetical protein